jgi:hypothetical protein
MGIRDEENSSRAEPSAAADRAAHHKGEKVPGAIIRFVDVGSESHASLPPETELERARPGVSRRPRRAAVFLQPPAAGPVWSGKLSAAAR